MAEYIEREAAIKVLRGKAIAKYPASFYMGLFAASNELDDIPSADVAPVRHGYWVIDDNNTRECHCSECDWPAPRDAYGYHREQTGYCHVCGAKMDGGAE